MLGNKTARDAQRGNCEMLKERRSLTPGVVTVNGSIKSQITEIHIHKVVYSQLRLASNKSIIVFAIVLPV